jgi:hypothetical protein
METQEQIDLKILEKECSEIRKRAFSSINNILRLKPDELKNTGYKTNESAAIGHFKYRQQKIEKLYLDYFKKYPD